MSKNNIDTRTVASFGEEWSQFDQTRLDPQELARIYSEYFSIFPWEELPPLALGMDVGCGSGRWAQFVSERVGHLCCVDPSEKAIAVARSALLGRDNISFVQASCSGLPVADASLDFCYSLGVLHHVPDTSSAIKHCVDKLKPSAPLLLYLYYRFDNKPLWFKLVWKLSDVARRLVSELSPGPKLAVTNLIATFVYYPLAMCSKVLSSLGLNVESIPLSYYRDHSFFTMRTDSRDRFGTPLEQRFTLAEIISMLQAAGLEDIEYSQDRPFWCVVGRKSRG